MKTILALLKAGQNVFIGGHEIIAYSDGKSIGVRLAGSLSSGSERLNMTGLRRLLKWMGIGIEIDMHFKPQTLAACREAIHATDLRA